MRFHNNKNLYLINKWNIFQIQIQIQIQYMILII